MRYRVSILCVSLLIAITAMATGEVRWLKTTHDFGAFDEDIGKVSCNIQFINDGDSAVVITSVRPTCGCTASQFTHSAIAPNDTASITLTYNPKGRPGAFNKDIIVYTNTEPKRHVISITGNVIGASNTIRSKFPIAIGNLKVNTLTIPFGELRKGQAKSAFIDGYNQSNESIKLAFTNIPKHVKVTSVPEIVPPGGIVSISVFYNTINKKDWGLATDSFTIVANDFSAKVDIAAIITEDFSHLTDNDRANAPILDISAQKLDFGSFMVKEAPISKDFIIFNRGKDKLLIRKIYTLDKGIIIDAPIMTIKGGKSAKIRVTINPNKLQGDILNSKITIFTNAPETPRSFIRIVGEIKK
ncbi:MAG: DUF1573 domain-containing protein [Muribaculaceae bacterium]